MLSHYAPAQHYTPGISGFAADAGGITNLDWKKVTNLEAPAAHDFPPGFLTCPNFFSSLSASIFTSESVQVDWKYTQRRNAQKIFPFLYLGPATVVKDLDFLKSEGITLLLAIRRRHPAFATIVNGDKAAGVLGIESDAIEVEDNLELTAKLPNAIRRINDHICNCGLHGNQSQNGPKKVLLFCESGNDKSAALAMGYLMGMLNLDAETAAVNVQARRFSTVVDAALTRALAAFDSVLDANRVVTRSRQLEPPRFPQARTSHSPSKRPRSPSPDSMEEDNGNMDQQRFGNRAGSAPFQDV